MKTYDLSIYVKGLISEGLNIIEALNFTQERFNLNYSDYSKLYSEFNI